MHRRVTENEQGMSLVEVAVVVAITLAVAGASIPKAMNAMDAIRLRSGAQELVQLIQRGRTAAIVDDRNYPLHASVNQAWVDMDNDSVLDPAPSAESSYVEQLPRGVTFTTAGAPSLSSMGLSYTPNVALPAFNARGTPCVLSGNTCPAQTAGGFVYYLTQTRSYSTPGWAAVTVSAAGRVRTWIWNGSAWQ